MRLSKQPEDDAQTFGRFLPGRIFVRLDRGDYWQCAYVIQAQNLLNSFSRSWIRQRS
jgi:hypothetical protein